MGRIWRLTAVAAGAALLGLAASAWVGAQLCKTIATDEPVAMSQASEAPRAEVFAQAASCQGPLCAKDDGSPPRDEIHRAAEAAEAMAEAEPATARPPASKRRRARAARLRSFNASVGEALLQELGRGITRLGRHRYGIKPAAVQRALGNLRWLSRAAHVAPEVRDGKPTGFRIVWVKAEGPIARLGLREGDVLVAVNGLDITTPDRVLDAYGKLKSARRLTLGLAREGRRVTLEYVIR